MSDAPDPFMLLLSRTVAIETVLRHLIKRVADNSGNADRCLHDLKTEISLVRRAVAEHRTDPDAQKMDEEVGHYIERILKPLG